MRNTASTRHYICRWCARENVSACSRWPENDPACFGESEIRWPNPSAPALIAIEMFAFHETKEALERQTARPTS